ncbi:MAG: hypothetical protein LBT83_09900, partial [Tannerella sp.]|nr:hypothetical protein [Tannerella sp.]
HSKKEFSLSYIYYLTSTERPYNDYGFRAAQTYMKIPRFPSMRWKKGGISNYSVSNDHLFLALFIYYLDKRIIHLVQRVIFFSSVNLSISK